MNYGLSGHQSVPESLDGCFERFKREDGKDSGCATYTITFQFNRLGSLVAVGCNDGKIEIWDFTTRRIVKTLIAHAHPVCSLSWSRDSRWLISASTDNSVSIWDVVTSGCLRTFNFPCPVLRVQFNPRNKNQILVCPMHHPPVVLHYDDDTPIILKPNEPNVDMAVIASYDRRGTYIYTGNSKGRVAIYRSSDFREVSYFKCSATANAAIKSFEFSRRGDYFLINCADKVIRVYDCASALAAKGSDVDPSKKLRDLVTGNHWRKCCFSGDGEFVCAGSVKQHSIYFWDRGSGVLSKILHGQKGETLLDVIYHPFRPIILSMSNSVSKEQISVWSQTQVQNWSAFAPDFTELDENVEYEERESEFDYEDEDKQQPVDVVEVKNDQDEYVDVETLEPVAHLMSSDEEEECPDILMFLSVSPEVDNPDDQQQASDDHDSTSANSSGDNCARVDGKRRGSDSSTSIPPAKQAKPLNVQLPDAVTDQLHPLVGSRRPTKSQTADNQSRSTGVAGGPRKTAGRQRDRTRNRR